MKSEQPMPMQVDGEDAIPSYLPTAEQMFKVTAPEYKPSRDVKSECLGRLVFEVGREIQWPTRFNSANPDGIFNRSFSLNVADRGDTMRFGNTYIAVIGSVEGVEKEGIYRSTPAALEEGLRKLIAETRAYIERQKKVVKNIEIARKEIAEAEEWIRDWEKTIKEEREKFQTFDPGLSESRGYWTSKIEANHETNLYSIFRAYLPRGEYIYVFESTAAMKAPSDKEKHKRDFLTLLAKFRTRAPNEIPDEPGVCFPFGFIPDDGRTVVEFKQSLRFPDAPGVLYTIETGTVHPRRLKATPLLAAASASINPPPATDENEIRPVVTQRIGPHLVNMGGLRASQGGVVLTASSGGEKYDIYSVFTGSSGWLGTAVLPYIMVEMRSFTKERAPELNQNPPPFKQSKDRLDVMLKSMRWRPTNPPMSEFGRK
ncbi:T6SS immunity protein Tli4 family protein [Telluria sp. B2]